MINVRKVEYDIYEGKIILLMISSNILHPMIPMSFRKILHSYLAVKMYSTFITKVHQDSFLSVGQTSSLSSGGCQECLYPSSLQQLQQFALPPLS